MITKERAIELGEKGGTLYHRTRTNADGSAFRVRVNGKCRTWKRDEARWELPIKHGLRDCAYLGVGIGAHCDPADWTESEPINAKELARLCKSVGLAVDCPLYALADALEEGGKTWEAARVRAWIAETSVKKGASPLTTS